MAHLSIDSQPLAITHIDAHNLEDLAQLASFNDVCLLRLSALEATEHYKNALNCVGQLVADVAQGLGPNATLITLGEVTDLVQVQAQMPSAVRYQHWIAIERSTARVIDNRSLPHSHFGALIHTRYPASLRHTKTRILYTYCPTCDKTTKDYGGKKHTYHESGTLISDVWRDVHCDLEGDITPVLNRFADFFGLEPYHELRVIDCRPMNLQRITAPAITVETAETELPEQLKNQILQGDCLETLRKLPDNSLDFAFTDPPYNLGKNYLGYTDDLEIQEYFNWCDQWLREMARVLKPGRTCAVLNIPLWAVRHFLYLNTILEFQNWIVWDALAYPVRLIMPAHYTILCFSKGTPRELPGLIGTAGRVTTPGAPATFKALEPLASDYCLRSQCVTKRQVKQINDRGHLTDVWSDIHRLKHNTRRVDHPCQLPPHLLYRLISIFTQQGEVVLDCFNGAGTTTLAADQLERNYIGIELSEKYAIMARERHAEIDRGLDPFRKEERTLTAKNSPVPRLKKIKYEVPKKTLQLEVKRVADELGHLPTREELKQRGKYPIKYYDDYFVSWGEVCAAARTTGMTEERSPAPAKNLEHEVQLSLGLSNP